MSNCESRNAGIERGTDIMWFHKGFYTEMMQEVTINGRFPAARPSSLSLKNILEMPFH